MREPSGNTQGKARTLCDQDLTSVWGGSRQMAVVHLHGYLAPYVHVSERQGSFVVDTNLERNAVTRNENRICVTNR